MSTDPTPERAHQYRQSMGMGWFVSRAYHEHLAPEHRNWECIPTAAARQSAYNNSRPWHAVWLTEVPLMEDAALNRNKIGLVAADIKRMARELLELPALQEAAALPPAQARARRPPRIKGLVPLIRRGASLQEIYRELGLKHGADSVLDKEIARQLRKAEVGQSTLAAFVRMQQQRGDWEVTQEGRTTTLFCAPITLKLMPDVKPERLARLPEQLAALNEQLDRLRMRGAGRNMYLKLDVMACSPSTQWHEGEPGAMTRQICEDYVHKHWSAFECRMFGCNVDNKNREEMTDKFCRFVLTMQLPIGFHDHRQGPAYYRYPTYYFYFKLPFNRCIRINFTRLVAHMDMTEQLLGLVQMLKGFGNIHLSC